MPFSIISHTADTGFEAWGSTPLALVEESVIALFSIILGEDYRDLSVYGDAIKKSLVMESSSLELLLHDILEEVLFWFEDRRMVVFGIKNGKLDTDSFRCDLNLVARTLVEDSVVDISYVKAITYHSLEFKKKGELWRARVILDV